jgi:YtkA-like
MQNRSALIATLTGLAIILAYGPAIAGANDYGFEPVVADVRNGERANLAVRLVHLPAGKPVAGAIVFRTRLDMSPDGMATMTAKHEAMPETKTGVYRFTANLTMAGGWALKLMAKVQGEAETVTGTVVFTAKD